MCLFVLAQGAADCIRFGRKSGYLQPLWFLNLDEEFDDKNECKFWALMTTIIMTQAVIKKNQIVFCER